MEQTSMEFAEPFSQLKLALVGVEKSWKSRTAATGRKPVLFLDFDQRKEAIAGYKDVYAFTFADKGSYFSPEAYTESLDVFTRMEESLLLKSLGFDNAPEDAEVQSLVFDSIQNQAKAAMRFALYNTGEIRREIKIEGRDSIRIPKSFDAWKAEMTMVEDCILRALALRRSNGNPVDVIIILHEVPEEAPESTEKNPVYTGKACVYPVRYKGVLNLFNEVWRMELVPPNNVTDGQDANIYVGRATTAADYNFNAASNLLVNQYVERPNIAEMIETSLRAK